MSSSREALRLSDIVENIDLIFEYVAGLSPAAFEQDRRTVDATERCLERVAEAVVKIGSDRMRIIAPDLPFERVRGLGNNLRHAYDTIDLAFLLNLIRDELPSLRDVCVQALADQ